jgi:GT2 family glycosyltransferase
MTMPAVSVVIPVYNGTAYLREAIDSVLAQTFTAYELLVIDDGSTDGTWELIQSYGSRLRGIRKSNGGVASALNVGIQHARGQWIAWLSHDDAFLPDKLRVQLECLANSPDARVCYTDYWVADEKSERQGILRMPTYPSDRFVRHLFQCMFVCGSTVLAHRECFEAEGLFDESLRYSQDADMWLRLARRFSFVHLAEPLIQWRYHAGQGSRNEAKMLADRQTYLVRCLERFALVAFFPELRLASHPSQAAARARLYLAQVMLSRHREPSIALQQYVLACRAWRSPRNPAFVKTLGLLLGGWMYYWLGRKGANLLRRGRPSTTGMPGGDLIGASRVVDFPIT